MTSTSTSTSTATADSMRHQVGALATYRSMRGPVKVRITAARRTGPGRDGEHYTLQVTSRAAFGYPNGHTWETNSPFLVPRTR